MIQTGGRTETISCAAKETHVPNSRAALRERRPYKYTAKFSEFSHRAAMRRHVWPPFFFFFMHATSVKCVQVLRDRYIPRRARIFKDAARKAPRGIREPPRMREAMEGANSVRGSRARALVY